MYISALHSELYEQGSFDHLCGIYGVLNSLAVMRDDVDCEALFAAIIKRIGKHLPAVLLHGMAASELEKYVLKVAAAQYGLCYQKLPNSRDLDRFWAHLNGHIALHGVGSVLLGIFGTHNHWSCVKKLTDRSIILRDSMGMKRIHRAAITLDERQQRRHVLCPQQTYLLSL